MSKVYRALEKENFETQVASGAAWVGSPERIVDQIHAYRETVGFDVASMQVNFGHIPFDAAERSMRLFGEKVIPRFAAG